MRRDAFHDGKLSGPLTKEMFKNESGGIGFPAHLLSAAAETFFATAVQRLALAIDDEFVVLNFNIANLISLGSGAGKSIA